jgi:hypothetical protein
MAGTVHAAQYFKMKVPDKPGVCARTLQALRNEGVNLLAFSGFPKGRGAQLDFVVTDAASFKAAAKRAKVKVKGPKTCFVAQGDDRPGAVADVIGRLADAKINITALDAVCGGEGRFGALFWVRPGDVKKASKILGAV